MGVGKKGWGWFRVKGGAGRPAQKTTGGALPARFASARNKGGPK